MEYSPLSKQSAGRVWFITDVATDGSVTISDLAGTTTRIPARAAERLRALKGTTYSLVDPSRLILGGQGPEHWRVHKYHKRKTKMTYDAGGHDPGLTVYPLAQFTNDPTHLAPFFTALEEYGVPCGSLSGMAVKSWRRSLERTINITSPTEAHRSAANAFTGGRRESIADKAVFNGTAYMDLPAAYLRSMQAPLPTNLVAAYPRLYDTGIAEASVFVPDVPGWKPLPISRRQKGIVLANFATGWLGGTWTFEELRLAQSYGYKIEIHQAWAGTNYVSLFDVWLQWAYDLRTLPGPAGRLAKQFTTRLWALFGINENSTRTIISFDSNGDLLPSKKLPKLRPTGDTKYLSAIIAARTRVALWEGLIQGGVWADTDGVIIPLDKAYSLEKAGWKRKEAMSVFQIEDWAHTRYHCIKQTPRGITDVCSICSPPRWHYRIDGVTPDSDDARVAWGLYTPGEYWETDSQGVTLASDDAERFRNSRPSVLPYDKIPIQRGI